jgi:hypothetical protein
MGVRLSVVCLLPMAGKLPPSYFRAFVSRDLQSISAAFDAGTNLFPFSLQQQKLVPVTIEDHPKVLKTTTKASIVSNLMGPYAMQLPMRMALGSPGVLARTQELPGKYSVKRKDKDPTLDVHQALVHHLMGKRTIQKPVADLSLRLGFLTFPTIFDRLDRYQTIEDILLRYTKDNKMQDEFTSYMEKCHDMLILLRMANELLHNKYPDQSALSMCFIDSGTFTPIVNRIQLLMVQTKE